MRQLVISNSFIKRDEASLEKYLQDIGQEKTITPEEEVELSRRIKTGDKEALDKLTKANLRFVVSVAKQYQNQGLSLADLINEGNVGLMKAAERFDESRGFKFISYAVWWIRQSILQALAENSRIVRLPVNKANNVNRIKRALNKFEQENERIPNINEIAERLDLSEEKVAEAMKATSKHISVDVQLREGDNVSLLDMLSSEEEPSTDNKLVVESMREEIKKALSVLNEREKNIVMAFYGIGKEEMTFDEIAKMYGLSRERVRQIKEKAIRKLRHFTKNKGLKTYLSN